MPRNFGAAGRAAGLLLVTVVTVPAAAAELSIPQREALLRKADVGAGAPASFRALLQVRAKGRSDRGRIEVWRSREARTLVRFLDPGERGKYLVYTSGELWFLAPGARKPVKLPPAFRIQGAATLDDILGRRYSRDYRIRSAAPVREAGRARVAFELEAGADLRSPFASVLYVVDAATAHPDRAELRLKSGRLATTIVFEEWWPGPRLMPRRLTLRDELKGGARSEVELLALEEREVPAGLFSLEDATERRRLEAQQEP